MALKDRLAIVQKKIDQAASGKKIVLIAVSKGQKAESILELYEQGHRDFGENYAQEFLEKQEWIESKGIQDIRWHFIGHLQSNKIKKVVPRVSSIHSVHSIELARRIGSISDEISQRTDIFLEILFSNNPQKTGFTPGELTQQKDKLGLIKGIDVLGLMCIPEPEEALDCFQSLVKLEQDSRPLTKGFLSMGMSSDYELAIQNGATHVRIGTEIFGPRM